MTTGNRIMAKSMIIRPSSYFRRMAAIPCLTGYENSKQNRETAKLSQHLCRQESHWSQHTVGTHQHVLLSLHGEGDWGLEPKPSCGLKS